MRRLAIVIVVAACLLGLPEIAHACPVCFDSSDENRRAFLVTTAFLTLLPLGMVTGAGLWLRRRSRRLEREGALDEQPGG